MLRLAPSHPPLWRTASSMQLGPDGAVRLDDMVTSHHDLDGAEDALSAAHAAVRDFVKHFSKKA